MLVNHSELKSMIQKIENDFIELEDSRTRVLLKPKKLNNEIISKSDVEIFAEISNENEILVKEYANKINNFQTISQIS